MQVVLEPFHGRVRASSGAPLDIAVEAENESEAIVRFRAEMSDRISRGVRIVDVSVPETDNHSTNPWLAIAGIFKDDPDFDNWQEAIREARARQDAEPGPW